MLRMCKNRHVTGYKRCPLCGAKAWPADMPERSDSPEPEPEPKRLIVDAGRVSFLSLAATLALRRRPS